MISKPRPLLALPAILALCAAEVLADSCEDVVFRGLGGGAEATADRRGGGKSSDLARRVPCGSAEARPDTGTSNAAEAANGDLREDSRRSGGVTEPVRAKPWQPISSRRQIQAFQRGFARLGKGDYDGDIAGEGRAQRLVPNSAFKNGFGWTLAVSPSYDSELAAALASESNNVADQLHIIDIRGYIKDILAAALVTYIVDPTHRQIVWAEGYALPDGARYRSMLLDSPDRHACLRTSLLEPPHPLCRGGYDMRRKEGKYYRFLLEDHGRIGGGHGLLAWPQTRAYRLYRGMLRLERTRYFLDLADALDLYRRADGLHLPEGREYSAMANTVVLLMTGMTRRMTKQFIQALARNGKGDYDGALADLDRVLELAPSKTRVYFHRGFARLGRGDYDGAEDDYGAYLERSPDDAWAYFSRATGRNIVGDYDGALADANRALEIEPGLTQAYFLRGRTRLGEGDYDGAEDDYGAYLERSPDDAWAYFNRATGRNIVGDYDGALADANRALEIEPGLTLPYFQRGLVRFGKGDYDGAEADYSVYLESSWSLPYHARALANRALARYGKGDYDGAFADADRALEIEPGLTQAYFERGLAQFGRGDYDGAEADYDVYLERFPNDARAYFNRASARNVMGDYDGALADANRALEIEPGLTQAYFLRGRTRLGKGDYDGAEADYGAYLERFPDDARAYFNRATGRNIVGDYDGALADANRALEIEPGLTQAYFERGLARLGKGDYDGAEADYEAYLQRFPDDVEAYSNRASARFGKGDNDGGIADLRVVLELEPVPREPRHGFHSSDIGN